MARMRLFLVLLALLVACSTPAIQADIPALLTNPGEDTRLEIEQSLSAALDGAKITIAPDALTHSSVLMIEHGMSRSIDRLPELGRNPGRPEHFQLVIDGPQCVLVHQRTGLHWILKKTACVAE